jgi:hypothetical protein
VIATWPSPAGGEEYAVSFDRGRAHRLLVLPALFDEGNKLRHFTVEVMRRLDAGGIDSFLPDMPGCNESLAPLDLQALRGWREAAGAASGHYRATRVLCVRAGTLVAPPGVDGWAYAPVSGATVLNGLLRARVIASREAGTSETREALLETGCREGIELAGYRLGAAMVAELQAAGPCETLIPIAQADIGGAGLWLRSEPAHDDAQADRLAAIVLQAFTE